MIVVFVIDTSPSMRKPLVDVGSNESTDGPKGMSRLDLAKMAVEDVVRGLNKRVQEHNVRLQQGPELQKAFRSIGLGYSPTDDFLLLSTGRQHAEQPATAACGAGGRLIVGYGDHSEQVAENHADQPSPHHSNAETFQRELKRLQATDWEPGKVKAGAQGAKPMPFPEDGGGAIGLNSALSAGLQLLSRYRLAFRSTENYGMGRLPSSAISSPMGGPAVHALQPACLILITDGVCLRSAPSEGGGSLQLQYGNMPLREFYREPFRWDQRIFCLGVGGREGISSTQYLHPHLRALCEVTGGGHMMLRSSVSLSQSTDVLLKQIAPPRPKDLPVPDPLQPQAQHAPLVGANGTFVSGGPVCCFQALEGDLDSGQPPSKHRAMLLYVPQEQPQVGGAPPSDSQEHFQPPVWSIPESFFPSKKLDSLPPRSAQPLLIFSRYPARLGSKCFEAASVMKALNRLDQIVLANRKISNQASAQPNSNPRLLSRDVYVCEWISLDGKPAKGPYSSQGMAYFPVLVTGAGRPSLSDGTNYFNIGILHIPAGTSTLASSLNSGARVSTLTLLPPEPHVLLPLLIRAAEAEHRVLKKVMTEHAKDSASKGGATSALLQKQVVASRNVQLDEHWRTEFRAYLFRLPPYYQNAMKRALRHILPSSAHALLTSDGTEGALASQCFSKACLQKIRSAEQFARESNERLERQEAELRKRGTHVLEAIAREQQQHQQQNSKRWQNDQAAENSKNHIPIIGYGQYDPRSNVDSFLAALRNMPAPWRVRMGNKQKDSRRDNQSQDGTSETASMVSALDSKSKNALQALGDLPAECLMAYYESRRRWIFGGSGLTTRGLFVDGVLNDGSNMQQCGSKRSIMDDSVLSLAGVGVSQLNATTTTKMGDYRERLLWSRAPVVGYGSNDNTGVSATTAVNGAPRWSVDDDAMPITFFDPRTGEFADSVQARVRSRLMVNFGNPYKDKRADSLIPEKYLSQCPSATKGQMDDSDSGPMTPPGSPPHESYSATEGEGEAVFAGKPISRKSPVRKSPSRNDGSDDAPLQPPPKRQKIETNAGSAPAVIQDAQKDDVHKVAPVKQPPPPRPPPGQSRTPPPPPPGQSRTPPPPPPKMAAAAAKTGSPSAPPPPPPPKGVPKKPPVPQRAPAPQGKHRPPRPAPQGPPPRPPPGNQSSPSAKPPAPQQGSTPGGTRPPPPQQNAPSKPPAPKQGQPPPPAQPVKSKPNPPPQAQLSLQNPEQKPNVDLPPGWMCVWSKSQKRWYFFDTRTNKSVWQWPPP